MGNPIKEKLRRGEAVLGCFISVYAPALAEVAGYAGFDFVVIDNEHGPLSWGQVEEMIRACECSGVVPIVRVADHSPVRILKALDRGAKGVHIPQINSAEEARRAVAACKFAPEGIRGAAYSNRAAKYGASSGSKYFQQANDDVLIVAHIESAEAVGQIKEIMGSGIHAAFIGPTDLSVSVGLPDEPNHPSIQHMIDQVLEAGKMAGIPVGILANDEQSIKRRIAWGASYICVAATSVINHAFKRLTSCK